jgi:hypothetical protein
MTPRTWRIIDWLIPVAVMLFGMIPPEFIDSIKGRGAVWATAYGAVVVVGRIVYQMWKERRG